MDNRNRSSKPVFPTHINLNLQALPATNIPEQLRKSRRQQNFEIDKQLANRLTLQSRPRFSSKSRDSSVSRSENYLRGRSSQSEKIIAGPSGDHDYSQPNTSSPISSAFMVSDRDFDPVNLNPASRERSGRETPEEIQYRTASAKRRNFSERIDLDNRGLTEIPNLAGEEMLKLLNLQHNQILKLSGIEVLSRLVFLDLYDNQISDMTPLGPLRSLRVLMLGKNNIRSINGLQNMTKLDVLDIHSNRIAKINGIQHIDSLRVLNLAGNFLSEISNLKELENLTELNLRRNEITKVSSLEHCHFLQRVYLSFNKIERWQDIWCLSECASIVEISLDGNPLTENPGYRQTIIASTSRLKMLDGRRISEEEKRTAASSLKKEIEKRKAEERAQVKAERRKLAISNAARLWRSENRSKDESTESPSASPDFSIYLGPVNVLDIGDSHLSEFIPETNHIRLFGSESVQHVEKALAGNSNCVGIHLRFATGRSLIDRFPRIKVKAPSLKMLSFGECQIVKITDFDRLSDSGIMEIHVDSCNPVTKIQFWRLYLLQKVPTLEIINGLQKSPSETKKASLLFSNILSSQSLLPLYRLELREEEEKIDARRFSRVLDHCHQLERRRERVGDIVPAVWLTLLSEVTQNILDWQKWSPNQTHSTNH